MKTQLATIALLFTLTFSVKASPIAFEEVLFLVRIHESDSLIAQQIIQRRLLHTLTPQQEATLKIQGAPDALIQTLRNPNIRLPDSEAIAFEARREQQKNARQEAIAAESAAFEVLRERQQEAIEKAAAAQTTAIAQAATPQHPSGSYPQAIRTSANSNNNLTSPPRLVAIPIPLRSTPHFTGYPVKSYNGNTTIVQPDCLSRSRTTAGFDSTTRIQPDYLGGFQARDENGNITKYNSDYNGGFRGTDNNGNTTRIRPDYLGGFRASDDSGNVTRYHSDYLGGFRGTDSSGNSSHIRPDYLGGYRINR